MIDARRFERVRTISLDFDGVLATLVLGTRWAKTREKRTPVPLVTPALRSLKAALAALTEGLRQPLPQAKDVLGRLRSAGMTLYLLTSRTDERIAAAERWLDRYACRDLFDGLFFNAGGEDADRFKARTFGAHPIDLHVDDDPGTIACLSRLFPEKLFIHMDRGRRKGPAAGNVVVVHDWDEVAGLFKMGGGS